MHVMIYVYVVPYCFVLWVLLRKDADHLRRRKLRNQRLKQREKDQAKEPLLFPQQASIQHSGDLDMQPQKRRGLDSDNGFAEREDSDTSYDTGSYVFPSAQVAALRQQHKQHIASESEVDSDDPELGEVPELARSVDTKKERSSAIALNESLKQILRERTVPIRLLDSYNVKFVRKIGVGGYGEVYLADWQGKEVAVKRFVSEKSAKNFLKEVEVIRY